MLKNWASTSCQECGRTVWDNILIFIHVKCCCLCISLKINCQLTFHCFAFFFWENVILSFSADIMQIHLQGEVYKGKYLYVTQRQVWPSNGKIIWFNSCWDDHLKIWRCNTQALRLENRFLGQGRIWYQIRGVSSEEMEKNKT